MLLAAPFGPHRTASTTALARGWVQRAEGGGNRCTDFLARRSSVSEYLRRDSAAHRRAPEDTPASQLPCPLAPVAVDTKWLGEAPQHLAHPRCQRSESTGSSARRYPCLGLVNRS